MTQLKTDLSAIRALLADPKRWTQGVNARNEHGMAVSFAEDQAVCFCLDGAAAKITKLGFVEKRYAEVSNALSSAVHDLHDRGGYVPFNDDETTSHADVIALLDYAIEHAK